MHDCPSIVHVHCQMVHFSHCMLVFGKMTEFVTFNAPYLCDFAVV